MNHEEIKARLGALGIQVDIIDREYSGAGKYRALYYKTYGRESDLTDSQIYDIFVTFMTSQLTNEELDARVTRIMFEHWALTRYQQLSPRLRRRMSIFINTIVEMAQAVGENELSSDDIQTLHGLISLEAGDHELGVKVVDMLMTQLRNV